MQELLNILQRIKDQAGPTLTHSVYERHPIMVLLDIGLVIVAILFIIVLALSVFEQMDDIPITIIFAIVGYIAGVGYLHNIYRYEMTKESEQRVNTVLMAMPTDEYTELVRKVKLADLNQIDDVMLQLIAKRVKNINTTGLFK